MARVKQYSEEEVIKKATEVFWRNGYEATSVRMLEKAMGINQFSIYSSFKNKQGVFIESLKYYRKQIKSVTDPLAASNNGIEGIRTYFYDFLEFSKDKDKRKGCLITNTVTEIGEDGATEILGELTNFAQYVRGLFIKNLKQDPTKNEETVERQGNYLITAMLGLSAGSKILKEPQLIDFIETTFSNL